MGGLQGWHLLILLAIIILIFGAARLPALAKSMGQSARLFKNEMKQMKDDDVSTAEPTTSTEGPASPGRTLNGNPLPDDPTPPRSS